MASLRCAESARADRRIDRGFTLIEVLVVVAIIALLVSILLPSLAKARAQTKIVACRANLHDLGQAFNMYANAYRGFFPVNFDPFVDCFQGVLDAKLLKNARVLVCPSTSNVVRSSTLRKASTSGDYQKSNSVFAEDPSGLYVPYIASSDISKHAGSADDATGGHSYEYLAAYKRDSSSKWYRRRLNQTYFPPSEMLLVHDEDDAQPKRGSRGCTTSVSGDGNNCPQPWDNHGVDGMNMMFDDGHAQFTRKVAGMYVDYSTSTPTTRKNENASIDRIWQKSSAPYVYKAR